MSAKPTAELFVGPFFPDLESLFLKTIAERKDPLSPVWVLAPTGALQRRLRRQIALQGGAMNVRFFGFESLAEELAQNSPVLQEKNALPGYADVLLLEAILAKDKKNYFYNAAPQKGLASAVLSTLRDLKDAGIFPKEFETTAQKSNFPKKLDSLSWIYSELEKAKQKRRLSDSSDRLIEAVNYLRSGRAPVPQGLLFLVYGVYDFTGLQRELLRESLIRVPRARVYFPPQSNYSKPAFEFFQEMAGSCTMIGQGSPERQIIKISAAGGPEELREVVREIQAMEDQGISLDEIGIIARSATRYESSLWEQFSRSTIPVECAKPRSLAQTPLGQAFLLFLKMAPKGVSRRELFSWLSLSSVDFANVAGAHGASPFAWDALCRKAGIAKFEDGWEDKLRSRGLESGEAVSTMRTALSRLLDDLSSLPSSAAPSRMAEVLRQILARVFLKTELREALEQSLTEFAKLDLAVESVERGQLSGILTQLLEGVQVEERESGVFFGDALSARGLSFRVVFLLGLEEKEFPRPVRIDSILLDSEREWIASRLPKSWLQLKARSREEEEYLFTLSQQSAREKLFLLRSRLDPVTGREISPSPFWERFPSLTESMAPLKHWSSRSRGEPSSLLEFDLRRLDSLLRQGSGPAREYLRACFSQHRSSLELEEQRWRRATFTAYDGALDIKQLSREVPGFFFADVISPTRFEQFAKCPFQYFLQRGLGLAELERPEEDEEMGALDRGSFLHQVLAAFFSSLDSKKMLQDYSEEELLNSLDSRFEQIWSQWEKEGIPGTWADRKAVKKLSLEDVRKYVRGQREENLPVPAQLEWPIPEGTWYSTGKNRFQIRGRIDRIDLEGDLARVVDFKSGRRQGHKECLDGGKRLQISLYAHAVEKHFPVKSVTGEYHYLRKGEKAIPLFLHHSAELAQTVDSLIALSQQGLFPQVPDDNEQGNCHRCEFRLVCAGEQKSILKRKRKDPRFVPFLKMRFEEDGCPAKAQEKPKKGKKK